MKKVLAIILSVAMLICACSFAVSAGTVPSYMDPGCLVRFENSMDWDMVYLFAWDEYGDPLCGKWPGTALENFNEAENGKNVYYFSVPYEAEGFLLCTCSDDIYYQTADITDFEYDSFFYLDGTQDLSGHYIVRDYTEEFTESTTLPENTNPKRKEKLHIIDNFGWNTAYLYAWDSNNNPILGEWPGEVEVKATVSDFGENEFLCEIPKNAAGIVINNGQGAQSDDITDFYNYDGYWFDGTKNDLGGYIPTGFVNQVIEDTTIEPTEELTIEPTEESTIESTEKTTEEDSDILCTIEITDSFYWGTAYLYAWSEEGGSLLGDWPGTVITDTHLNAYGQNIFRCAIPKGAEGVVINNGSDQQSVDLTEFTEGDSYWFDGTKDELSHYYLTPYYWDDEIPDGPVPEEFYFLDSQNFNSVYLYAWNAEGDVLTGEWPGTFQQLVYEKDINTPYDMYLVEIPYNAVGFVLNDGYMKQTVDVVQWITSGNSYWLDGSKDERDHYLFKSYPGSIVPTTEPEYETKQVYVNDDYNWGAGFLYAWDNDSNALTSEWPGDQVKKININGTVMFVCDVPVNAKGFILSNTDISKRIQVFDYKNYDAFRILNEAEPSGAYKVEGYNFDFPPFPDQSRYFYLENSLDWDEFYFYAWDSNDVPIEVDLWPGNKITTTLTGADGETIIKCRIPECAETIMINNGSDSQTIEFNVNELNSDDGTVYYMDGSIDDLGYYYVKPRYMFGDVNGDNEITVADATLIQKHAAELITLSGSALSAADTNHDGIVSVSDATLVQQFAAEIITTFV